MSDPDRSPDPTARWKTLPPPIPAEQMVTEQPTQEAPDPEMGRDANQEWMLKYS
jgi:hypothetical protein